MLIGICVVAAGINYHAILVRIVDHVVDLVITDGISEQAMAPGFGALILVDGPYGPDDRHAGFFIGHITEELGSGQRPWGLRWFHGITIKLKFIN